MFHRIAFITSVIGMTCLSAYAGDPPVIPTTQQAPGEYEAAIKLAEKKLQAVIPDFQLGNATLTDAFDRLRKVSGEDIFINWKTLETAGVQRDARITLHLNTKRVSTILDIMLRIIGADGEKLAFSLDDGVITVSTAHDFSLNTITRVYDLRPMVGLLPGPAADARVAAIEKLIMNQVDPESWKDRGGDIGALRVFQGQMIVTQTPEIQTRIAALLKDLLPLLAK